jgi:hypothetical protein
MAGEEWTISEQEYLEREEATQRASEVADVRIPEPSSWGFFSYGDAPGAIGGGVGSFLWVDDEADLVPFLAEHLTFLAPGMASIDPGRVDREVHERLRGVTPEEAGSAEFLQGLNEILHHFSQVEWIGKLDELMRGSGDFPCRVRERYRSDVESEGAPTDPIPDEELDAFREQIRQYGI